ncbi:hypothetical protein K8T06_11885 [bacterium]|nr:hypothetical protein [bacterium]
MAKDPDVWLERQREYLVSGNYDKCRAYGEMIATIWSAQSSAVNESRRLAAWSALFAYKIHAPDLTTLELDKRNVEVTKFSIAEFNKASSGDFRGESTVLERIFRYGYLDQDLFERFSSIMKDSVYDLINSAGISRQTRLTQFINENPEWSQNYRIEILRDIPWKRTVQP